MSLFSKHTPDSKLGALVDIGSGSVGVAIVLSDPELESPTVIWNYRENMRLGAVADLPDTQKRLGTALMNAFMELGSTGLAILQKSKFSGDISTIQLTVSAPWSYTITKVVTFTDEEPFKLNEALMRQLTEIAQKKVTSELKDSNTLTELNLEIITESTVAIEANGYLVKETNGQTVENVSLARVSSLAQTTLINQVREAQEKIMPKTNLTTYSFMSVYYQMFNALVSSATEVCLVDVTREATEMGVVRDGVLKYSTHIPYGSFSLARDIATALNTTPEEAFSYLKNDNENLQANVTNAKSTSLLKLFTEYEQKISDLFTKTGDSLSIPKLLFFHTEHLTSDFFNHRITKAAKRATNTDHHVVDINQNLNQTETEGVDKALLLSAHYFHQKNTVER